MMPDGRREKSKRTLAIPVAPGLKLCDRELLEESRFF